MQRGAEVDRVEVHHGLHHCSNVLYDDAELRVKLWQRCVQASAQAGEHAHAYRPAPTKQTFRFRGRREKLFYGLDLRSGCDAPSFSCRDKSLIAISTSSTVASAMHGIDDNLQIQCHCIPHLQLRISAFLAPVDSPSWRCKIKLLAYGTNYTLFLSMEE